MEDVEIFKMQRATLVFFFFFICKQIVKFCPSSPADIQSARVITADSLISQPGDTRVLCSAAMDLPPGGPGSTR